MELVKFKEYVTTFKDKLNKMFIPDENSTPITESEFKKTEEELIVHVMLFLAESNGDDEFDEYIEERLKTLHTLCTKVVQNYMGHILVEKALGNSAIAKEFNWDKAVAEEKNSTFKSKLNGYYRMTHGYVMALSTILENYKPGRQS